jgi:peptidoglycan hydrolase CwlO-like protein
LIWKTKKKYRVHLYITIFILQPNSGFIATVFGDKMSVKESFNQSDIDKIVASAESDTVESKIENLEKEVTEIKGSIKALLMDIRETMGVLENPFQDIQPTFGR